MPWTFPAVVSTVQKIFPGVPPPPGSRPAAPGPRRLRRGDGDRGGGGDPGDLDQFAARGLASHGGSSP
jgi:hypothetical protein